MEDVMEFLAELAVYALIGLLGATVVHVMTRDK